jgi:hypothetical protein
MEQPDDVDYWRSFFEDYTENITQYLLQYTTSVKLSVSCNCNYGQHDTGIVSESMTMNSAFPALITRHTVDLSNKVQNQFLAVHNPNLYARRLQEQFGSNIGHLKNYNSFTISFAFPYEYNTRALPTNFRLHSYKLSDFLKYLPYNNDNYCVLHSIFAGEKQFYLVSL